MMHNRRASNSCTFIPDYTPMNIVDCVHSKEWREQGRWVIGTTGHCTVQASWIQTHLDRISVVIRT